MVNHILEMEHEHGVLHDGGGGGGGGERAHGGHEVLGHDRGGGGRDYVMP